MGFAQSVSMRSPADSASVSPKGGADSNVVAMPGAPRGQASFVCFFIQLLGDIGRNAEAVVHLDCVPTLCAPSDTHVTKKP